MEDQVESKRWKVSTLAQRPASSPTLQQGRLQKRSDADVGRSSVASQHVEARCLVV